MVKKEAKDFIAAKIIKKFSVDENGFIIELYPSLDVAELGKTTFKTKQIATASKKIDVVFLFGSQKLVFKLPPAT